MAELDVESVLSKLSQREKIDLLSGKPPSISSVNGSVDRRHTGGDFWHTKSLPKHGVPGLRLSDGPNGIRGQTFFAGTRGAVS